MQDSTTVVVGIDVGGTKTHLRACAPVAAAGIDTDTAVADHVRPSSGWRPHDPGRAARWLADLVHGCLPAGVRPAAVAVGGHACETPHQCELIRDALHGLLGVPCLVVNDSALLVPAAGLASGVGLVAGTGSVAVGQLADGTSVQVGGWGAVLGDEGSAAGLVREAARAVWAAHDRGEAPDELARRLLASLGVPEVPAIGAVLESADSVSSGWGRHAVSVFEAADAGSRTAREVVVEGGRALAALVERLAARGAAVDDVVVAGGTVLAQPALFDALAGALADALPGTRLRPLRVAPVVGAVALARTLVGGHDALPRPAGRT